MDPLAKYQSMRDFGETPEPAGAVSPPSPALRFVVQEHHATALHWDLRLEHDGVLASWALPKGVPPDPRVNHLAVHTEDHPMQYLDFGGEIPAGNYGAGTMSVWDTGTYEVSKWGEREVVVTLHGGRVDGRYALFQTRGNQWMIHRMDPPADPDREVWPGWDSFPPLIPVASCALPAWDPAEYAVEFAWGGTRVLAYVSGGRVQLHPVGEGDAPEGRLISRFPELRGLGGALGATEVVLDGSIVVPGPASVLEERLAAASDATARRLAARHPAVLMIYDLLWLDGHRTMSEGYGSRRRRLEALTLRGPAWQVPASHGGDDGPALWAAAGAHGLPGVVAKRLSSPYHGGLATDEWVFVPASPAAGGFAGSGQ